jgi:thioredoxin 1
MAIIHLKNSNFEQNISSGKCLIDFYATWCGPCQMLSPILEKISNENKNIKIFKVNVDDEMELAQKFNVTSIPSVFLLKYGKIIDHFLGFKTEEDIKHFINK